MLVALPVSAQDRFPFLMKGNKPIPDVIEQRVKFWASSEILFYKMVANPELTEKDYVEETAYYIRRRSAESIILPEPWDYHYKLDLKVERLQNWNDTSYYFKNFYLVTKLGKGNNFIHTTEHYRYIDEELRWETYCEYKDTLNLYLWDSIFNYDQRYIFYYDSISERAYSAGGDLVTTELNWDWFEGMNQRDYIDTDIMSRFYCRMRLDRFNIKPDRYKEKIRNLYAMEAFRRQEASDSLIWDAIAMKTKNPHHTHYFYCEGMDLTEGLPAIIKTKSNGWIFNAPVEVTYYKCIFADDDFPDKFHIEWKEIKYILKNNPKYEDNQPITRILTKEEADNLRKSPYKIFFYVPMDEYQKRIEEDIVEE
jgi:hypothetical protein